MRTTRNIYGIITLMVVWLKVTSAQEEEKQSYEVDARDPVPASTYFNTHVRKDGAYDNYDLGYYADAYTKYKPYILSSDYYTMKQSITNTTLVCVNFDVSVNGTYLGVFTCPLPGVETDEDRDMCCGEQYAEFCCYDTSWLTKERLYGGLALGGIIIVVVIIGILCYVFLGGKRK